MQVPTPPKKWDRPQRHWCCCFFSSFAHPSQWRSFQDTGNRQNQKPDKSTVKKHNKIEHTRSRRRTARQYVGEWNSSNSNPPRKQQATSLRKAGLEPNLDTQTASRNQPGAVTGQTETAAPNCPPTANAFYNVVQGAANHPPATRYMPTRQRRIVGGCSTRLPTATCWAGVQSVLASCRLVWWLQSGTNLANPHTKELARQEATGNQRFQTADQTYKQQGAVLTATREGLIFFPSSFAQPSLRWDHDPRRTKAYNHKTTCWYRIPFTNQRGTAIFDFA
jgi:hypothetical protein